MCWYWQPPHRSEEHTSELQSPYVISYAVFCLKKKNSRAPPPRLSTRPCASRPRLRRRAPAVTLLPRARLEARTPRPDPPAVVVHFFFNDTATTEIYTLSLHDALPICRFVKRSSAGCSSARTSSSSTRA